MKELGKEMKSVTHHESVARATYALRGRHGSQRSRNPPPHTHLSYFSRGDLPFVGASEHTGDVPVGKQGGLVSMPPGSLASRAGAGWLLDTHPWLACTQT